jgi:hypothetical protein
MLIVFLTQIGTLQIAKVERRFAASLADGFDKVQDAAFFTCCLVAEFLALGTKGFNKLTGCHRIKAKA